MQPWYIATKRFGPWDGETWRKYAEWAGLGGLRELVSLDAGLCPTLLPDIEPDYWPHIVNEDFMLHFFTDLDFLLAQIAAVPERNLLCVYRNPPKQPTPPKGSAHFEFVGYDVVDIHGDVSALTNCGGFPDVFSSDELLPFGLLPTRKRAVAVQAALKQRYPGHSHTDCHVWAVFRAANV
jgi:hypothetical protein